ncbi:hypothetical protein GCM10010247_19000 [Streptomyces calvus]|nr:hypothetical protein GCM10010247_19000 [Streptomyces calvus]
MPAAAGASAPRTSQPAGSAPDRARTPTPRPRATHRTESAVRTPTGQTTAPQARNSTPADPTPAPQARTQHSHRPDPCAAGTQQHSTDRTLAPKAAPKPSPY